MQEIAAPVPVCIPAAESVEASPVVFEHTPALDGVRGIAILAVMIYHLDWLMPSIKPYVTGGFLGVDIFFVLSGFLITSILLGEYEKTSTLNLKRFYIRRCLRLIPAFWLFLLCLYLFGSYLLPGFQTSLIEGRYEFLYAFTYTTNWFSATNNISILNLNHVWSLSIEEQFYILWSLVLYKAFAKKRGKNQILFATAGFVAAVCISRAVRAGLGWETPLLYYSTDTRIDSLLMGCIASMIFMWRIIPPSFLRSIWFKAICLSSLTAALTVVLTFSYEDRGLYLIGLPVFTASVAVMIYWLVCNKGTFAHKLLENRTLGWIGNISYGLYLWHCLFYDFAKNAFSSPVTQALTGIALAFSVSAISYYFLEQPFLRLKSRFNFNVKKA